MYSDLISEHPIDLCRYQVANCYMGCIGLINSRGASSENDFAVATSHRRDRQTRRWHVAHLRRKAFQRPMAEA